MLFFKSNLPWDFPVLFFVFETGSLIRLELAKLPKSPASPGVYMFLSPW